ncbi:RelA/SpoT domain-containing protein [Alteromonas lipolytica]|uniref:RelA/SpoT domain-containing protein n=1 Tax=Alteromonas lipolytica TaxID=1856405 RepID=A0A1E8FGS9_9ALTE|nr:RelA/SpoT domain-containing protein [Alteromonas lipolytica]OFI34798.1 hypothetical protein BFC17_14570 [Alteromonas lipolytica]GGF54086.1 (p)ppGpp synthetase [Alteromonas lipolytica]
MRKSGAPYSGKQITKAGKFLAFGDYNDNSSFNHCFDILVFWRGEHSDSLEEAFSLLQRTVKPIEKDALFAKRLKRYVSIVSKLQRFENMTLKKMQDIGGCRAVVSSEKKVRKIVRELRKSRTFKYPDSRFRYKDYIENPKEDGYRSYHMIGQFPSKDKSLKNIEIQIRTYLQHYWATALEIIDLFTNQSLKTNQGKKEWEDFFKLVGSLFAILDRVPSYHNLSIEDRISGYFIKSEQSEADTGNQLDNLARIIRKLDIVRLFSSFANSLKIVGDELNDHEEAGYILLVIDPDNEQLEYTIFDNRDSVSAQEKYAHQESIAASPHNNLIVALVYTSSIEDVREAYPNFFADSTKFIEHLNTLIHAEKIVKQSAIRRTMSKLF